MTAAAVVVLGAFVPEELARVAAERGIVPRRLAGVEADIEALSAKDTDVIVIPQDAIGDVPALVLALRGRAALTRVPILIVGAPEDALGRRFAASGAKDVALASLAPWELRNQLALLVELARARRAGSGAPPHRPVSAGVEMRERETVCRLLRAAQARDDETGDHVVRVACFAVAIAEALGLAESEVDDIALASTIHDISKIGVPDAILRKAGPLTQDERDAMRTHAEEGAQMLDGSTSRLLRLASEIALTHHERWDGTGYPRGLSGEAIPRAGRIVAVADVFDALTSSRVYKPAWPLDRARDYLDEHAGTQFDPACVAAFRSRWSDIVAVVETPHVSAA